jgi:pyruvate/2-oxoacid:ferredoxin oxidoreductase alpha subunit
LANGNENSTVLDGIAAVTATEAQRIGSRAVDDGAARSALAAAMGIATSGERAYACLAGDDLAPVHDLMREAAHRHLPLVTHVAGDAPHELVDTGAFVLTAVNVQEAVDLALVARRVAERTLVPGLVTMDAEHTAHAPQEVVLPDSELVETFLGDPAARITAPTEAQRLIFGETRRLVPRWFDPDHPLLLAPRTGPEARGLGLAARRPFFDEPVAAELADAFEAFEQASGRAYGPLIEHALDKARIVLVAEGAAVETAIAVARWMRHHERERVGVVGVRSRRPFPGVALAKCVAGTDVVAVMERADTPLAGDGPLAREVRAALAAARESAPRGAARDRPRVVGVPYGLGGLPLRAADLRTLARELRGWKRSRVYLGVAFTREASRFPKRQAWLDALRREAPELAELGLRSNEPPPDVRPDDAITIAVLRAPGDGLDRLAADVGAAIHARSGGHVRGRRDRITWSSEALLDPGDDVVANVTVVAAPRAHAAAPAIIVGDDVYAIAPETDVVAAVTELALGGAAPTSLRRVEMPRETSDGDEAPLPPLVRSLTRSEPTIDCIAHFWDQVGVLYRAGATDELTADPYLAAGALPAVTAACRAPDPVGVLPIFEPALCDGDGRLWTSCPDGSVAPLVIGPRALVDTGIALASERGRPADALRAVAGKLAKRAAAIMVEQDPAPVTAGGVLRAAFEAVAAKMDADRRAPLDEALAVVVDEIGALPIARTPVFFDEPEAEKPGTGELLSIAVDPDACRCPELILAEAGAHGLSEASRTPDRVADARRVRDLHRRLPDASATTIKRAAADVRVGPLAAALLGRAARETMAAGCGDSADAGARLALRRTLAIAEHVLRPRRDAWRERIDELRGRLAGGIRGTLADALPADDLDLLAEGLDALGRQDVDLTALSGRLDEAVTGSSIDGARLGRLVDVARGLADLHWRLSSGADGRGRAVLGLAIDAHASGDWAGVFPYNPFPVPAALDAGGETAAFARGLAEGPRRQAVAAARLVRWAGLELDGAGDAARDATALAALDFDDLDDDERALCPPMLVVSDAAALDAASAARLCSLLHDTADTRILLLGGPHAAAGVDVALFAVMAGRAFVTQMTLAHRDDFAAGVRAALEHDGPALIHVDASVSREPGETTQAFPRFRFDPTADEAGAACLELARIATPLRDVIRGETTRELEEQHAEALAQLRAEHEARLAALRDEFQDEAARRVADGLMTLAGYGRDGEEASP